jgi:hypothetical protein
VTLGHLSTGQPNPYRAVEPTGPFGECCEERLAEQEALSAWCDRPKPQFSSLIPTMQHDAPPEYRPFVPVPFEHSDELFA